MDHLPACRDPIYPPIEVPYLATDRFIYKYDYEGFGGYPQRCGYNQDDIVSGKLGNRHPDDLAAFLQSWLFFGMLGEFLKVEDKPLLPAIEDQLVKTTADGNRVIHTAPLIKAVKKWTEKAGALLMALAMEEAGLIMVTPQVRKEAHELIAKERERVDVITYESLRIVKAILTDYAELSGRPPLLPQSVALSIAVAGETLSNARNGALVWGPGYTNHGLWSSTPSSAPSNWERILLGEGVSRRFGSDGTEKFYNWGSFSLLNQKFEDKGWCRSEKRYLQNRLGAASSYYASNLRRYRTGLDHARCTELSCFAYQITDTYPLQHAEDCDGRSCGKSLSSPGEMIQIVERGAIPLLHVDSKSQELCVEAGTFGPDDLDTVKYVAFSHVWSDGLGNPFGNTLHRCQVLRLQDLANQEAVAATDSRPIRFWLDTLCVPEDPKELRRKAIEKMSTVYSKASVVLVLDAELQQVSSSVPYQEAMMRIALSAWNRRLWTLQEGALASRLMFQFRDKALSLEFLLESRINDESAIWQPLTWQVANVMVMHRVILRKSGSERLTALSRALQYRSVSKPEDEAVCLAALLAISVGPILLTPAGDIETRMRQVWASQEVIPKSILSLDGERLHEPPFRWAPKTLIGTENSLYDSRIVCRSSGDGLALTCPGFLLREPLLNTGKKTLLMATPHTMQNGGWFVLAAVNDGPPLQAIEKAAVLIPDPTDHYPTPSGQGHKGVLVSILDFDKSKAVFNVRYERSIGVVLHGIFSMPPGFREKLERVIGQLVPIEALNPDPDAYDIDWFLTAFPYISRQSTRVPSATIDFYGIKVANLVQRLVSGPFAKQFDPELLKIAREQPHSASLNIADIKAISESLTIFIEVVRKPSGLFPASQFISSPIGSPEALRVYHEDRERVLSNLESDLRVRLLRAHFGFDRGFVDRDLVMEYSHPELTWVVS